MIREIDELTVQRLRVYQAEVQAELTGNILPFYVKHAIDQKHGGFHGYVSNKRRKDKKAAKGVIQTTRILWAFAAARRMPDSRSALDVAERAFRYTLTRFWDPEFGGLYWMLDRKGKPVEATKMIYGQAFGIYAFAEYFMVTGEQRCLDKAVELYRLIEQYARDHVQGGYREACRQNWKPDQSRSVDAVAQPSIKSMNTHLHLLEAYTNLLRAWPDAGLGDRLRNLIRIVIDRFIDENSHFILHVDAKWRRLNDQASYGHDIEGSWLLVEAADVLGDAGLLAETQAVALRMAQATLNEGIDSDGGVFNEGSPSGITDRSKDWWTQAEAMVGFFNAYELSGDQRALEQSLATWRFIQRSIIDHQDGEWIWGVSEDGAVRELEKTGPWKAPYHNGRACMEISRRVDRLLSGSGEQVRVNPAENSVP